MSENSSAVLIAGVANDGSLANATGFAANANILPTMATAGTTYSNQVDCRSKRSIRFQGRIKTFSDTPVGKFQLQGCEEPQRVATDKRHGLYGGASESAQWTTLTLPDGSVHGQNGTVLAFAGPSKDITYDGSAAFNFILDVVNPPACLRIAMVRTAGGGANTDLRIIASMREE